MNSSQDSLLSPNALEPHNPLAKQKSLSKVSRIPIKVEHTGEVLKKPEWIRVKAASPNSRFYEIKDILRANKLVTVCEEASCPNIGECFGKGHSHLHDHGRQMHAPLPVLRRRPWTTRSVGCPRASQFSQNHCRLEVDLRGDYQRRP
jgi:hypothetical protein